MLINIDTYHHCSMLFLTKTPCFLKQLLSTMLWRIKILAVISLFTSPIISLESIPTQTYELMPSNHLILCCPLLLLTSIFPSIRVFFNELALPIRWPKYWSLASASALPVNIQGWFPLVLTGWISLQSKGLSRVFSSTTIW